MGSEALRAERSSRRHPALVQPGHQVTAEVPDFSARNANRDRATPDHFPIAECSGSHPDKFCGILRMQKITRFELDHLNPLSTVSLSWELQAASLESL